MCNDCELGRGLGLTSSFSLTEALPSLCALISSTLRFRSGANDYIGSQQEMEGEGDEIAGEGVDSHRIIVVRLVWRLVHASALLRSSL